MDLSHLISEKELNGRLLEEIAFLTLKVSEKDLIIESLVRHMVEDSHLTRDEIQDMLSEKEEDVSQAEGNTSAKPHKGV